MNVALCFILVVIAPTAFSSPSCITPNGDKAICEPIYKCPVILASLTNLDKIAQQFYQNSICGNSLVCCGKYGNYTELPPTLTATTDNEEVPELLENFSNTSICGLQELPSLKIKGGVAAELEEFPWVAALEYHNIIFNKSGGIRCGGSIINNRYILTAAHCIQSIEFLVVKVWLGAWNVSSSENCHYNENGMMQCINSTRVFNVEKRITHELYDKRHGQHDIGLLRLDQEIKFTIYIRPICLPSPNLLPLNNRALVTIAGWGATNNGTNSEFKIKAELPVRLNCFCKKRFNMNITPRHLCAGGEQNKNVCDGDSGGPLMKMLENVNGNSQWYQEGILSYGYSCDHKNSPSVYTRVAKYTTWIINNSANGSPCITPNDGKATSILRSNCSVIMAATSSNNSLAVQFTQDSQCGFQSEPLVCCGSTFYPTEVFEDFEINDLSNKSICGFETTFKHSNEGFAMASMKDFPWIAAIEYKSKKTGKYIGIKCIGSLINNQFILTAAHCLLYPNLTIVGVWLGPLNASLDENCSHATDGMECINLLKNLKIRKQISHEFYDASNGYNDIGLLRLENEVEFTDYIRPICLPPPDLALPEKETRMTVIQWKFSNLSDMAYSSKLNLEIPLRSNSYCNEELEESRNITLHVDQSEGEAKNYSKSGNLQGPFMKAYQININRQRQWYQEGVTSYCVHCNNTGCPAVYTRVSRYIDWIATAMEEVRQCN